MRRRHNGHARAEASTRRPTARAWLAAVLAMMAWGAPALAGPHEADQATGRVAAFRDHVARGAKLRADKEYRQALAEFQKARALADHPKLMYVTGRLRERIGDCAGARDDFQAARDDARTDDALRQRIERALQANRQCVSHGTLVVHCQPAGARLRVDERAVQCGATVDLTPGSHKILASAPGYRDLQMSVNIEPGKLLETDAALTRQAPAPVADAGHAPTWLTYGAYGAMGAGAALLTAGIISDATATGRQQDLAQASAQGDLAWSRRLIREAQGAQTRTATLYISGAVLAGAGVALWAYDDEVARWLDVDVHPEVQLGAQQATIGATVRW